MRTLGQGRFSAALVAFFLAIASSAGFGAVIRVDPASPTNGLGGSWSTAYHSLAAALSAATSGDEVHVAGNETYKPANQSSSFLMKAGVLVKGGYAGYGATNPDARDDNPTTNGCVLSGDLDSNGPDAGDCFYVVKAPNTGTMNESTTSLDGFTIESGWGEGASDTEGGAGILLDNNPLIRNCRIRNNHGGDGDGGGGVHVRTNRSPTFRNCIIENNTSAGAIGGGGVFAYEDTAVRLLNCTIHGNESDGPGGGVRADNATSLKIISCTISDNQGHISGGGVSVQGPSGTNVTVKIINCLIIDNTLTGTTTYGGGIEFTKGIGGVENCTFDGNAATYGGAYYQFNSATPNQSTIENSILWDNGSSEAYSDFGVLTIRESDVEGGSGAIGNSSNGTITYDGGSFATNNINADPLYDTPTYELDCGSPCMNTGDLTLVDADSENVDEVGANDGFPTPDRSLALRVIANAVDMGAFEAGVETDCCTGDTNNDGFVNVTDLLRVIADWTCTGSCAGDVVPNPCRDGVVNVSDLLAVIGSWGECPAYCTGTGGVEQRLPESYSDCQNMCSGLSGQDWSDCMMGCFKVLCEQGQTEFCDP